MRERFLLLVLAFFTGLGLLKAANNDIIVDLDGGIYSFEEDGKLSVPNGGYSALVLKNGTFRALQGVGETTGRLVFLANTSTLTLVNCTLALDDDYTWTSGIIYVRNTVTLEDEGVANSHVFGLMSTQSLQIEINSELILDDGISFSFAEIGGGVALASNNTSKFTTGWDFNSGLVNLDGLKSDKDIKLTNGSRASVRTEETLPLGASIIVYGEDNEIEVSNKLTISGDISFQTGSELTFIFSDDAPAADKIIYMNRNVTIPALSRLAFSGNGTVIFEDGSALNIAGEIAFLDHAKWTLASTSGAAPTTMTVNNGGSGGTATITVDNGGAIMIEEARHLKIGGQKLDTININVDRSGQIKAIGAGARISIYTTQGALDFEQEGTMIIGQGGTIEINSLNDVPQVDGGISSWTLDTDGKLDVRLDGTLIIGENYLTNLTTPTFVWNSRGGIITGVGEVRYANQLTAVNPSAFRGQNFGGQPIGVRKQSLDNKATAEEVFMYLVNTVNGLSDSAVMTNRLGESWLRIKNSAWIQSGGTAKWGFSSVTSVPVVKLETDDVIQREGNRSVGGRNSRSNENIKYDLDGIRKTK